MRRFFIRPPAGGGGCCAGTGQHCSVARLFLGVTLLVCIVLVAVTFDAAKFEATLLWVQQNKAQGSLLFLALYTAGVVLMLPAMVMAMAAGAVFGMMFGMLVAWVGSSVGQVIAFVAGRYLLRELVLGYLTRQFPKWTAVDRAMATDGWKLVTLLRLSPIAPWNILNYALAVTSVPLGAYTLASCLSILPYLAMFVYFGSLARNLADVFTGATTLDTRTTIVMGVVSGVAMVAVVWYTTHISRKAVAEALRNHAEELPPELQSDSDVVRLLGGAEVEGESIVEMSEIVVAPAGAGALPGAGGSGVAAEAAAMASPRGRRSGGATPSAAAAAEVAALLSGSKPGRGGGGAESGLHARSAHASPRSQSPVGSARWQQQFEEFRR